MIGIYKITSPSGKIYVGQSVDIERRFRVYRNPKSIKQQMAINNSILKYGSENHVFEVIEECNIDLLNERERYWQDFYNVLGKNGLNCKLTNTNDRSGKYSEATINKLRIASTGKKHSIETKKILSYKASLRKLSPERIESFSKCWKGRKRTDEDKLNKSKNSTKFWLGKKMSQEIKDKIKKNAAKPRSKTVLDTNTGVFYNSAKDVSELYNIPHSTLRGKLNGNKPNNTNFKYV